MANQNSINANTTTPLSPSNGGTGVSNGTNTLTVTSNSTIDQDVSTIASPFFNGVNVAAGGFLQGATSGTYTINAYNTNISSQTTLMSIDAGNPPTWTLGGAGFTGNIDNCAIGFNNASTGYFTTLKQGGNQISIGGSFTMSGVHTFTGNLTGDTNVTFPTSGTLATTTGGGMQWTSVSGNTTLVANQGLFVTGTGTQTLPATFAVGDTFIIINLPGTSFNISQNSGQSIICPGGTTTTGVTGGLASTGDMNMVTLVGSTANTTLVMTNCMGAIQGT